MPPRLVKGRAVGQRKIIAPPSVMTWCHCNECVDSKFVDPTSNDVLLYGPGRYVLNRVWRRHQQNMQRREIAQRNMASITSTLQSLASLTDLAGTEQGVDKDMLSSSTTHSGLQRPATAAQYTELAFEETGELTDSTEGYETEGQSQTPPTAHKIRRDMGKKHENKTSKPIHKRRIGASLSTQTWKLEMISQSLGILNSASFLKDLQTKPLAFGIDPGRLPPSDETMPEDPATYELERSHPSNYEFLRIESKLYDDLRYLQQELKKRPSQSGYCQRVQRLIVRIQDEQIAAAKIRRQSWLQQRVVRLKVRDMQVVESAGYMASLRSMEPISCLVFLISATIHFLGNLSLKDMGFYLSTTALLLGLAMKGSPNIESPSIIRSIPSDMRPVISSLKVDPHYSSMVCCPTCFQTYKFSQDDPTSYPELCIYRSTARSQPCGRRLRTAGVAGPKREYIYQDLPHWIARMYSRPDIEEHLDQSPPDLAHNSGEMNDIWDGSALRNFLGPDGQHFMIKPEDEGRLIFGLNMDGFNPYRNREAGKRVSICGIYLVCFNLPPEVRYKSENIFLLGIAPGPHEPSTHEVNHVLRPLVDDLLSLWYTGLYLTKTPKYPLGRPIRCTLVPIICDLPAARRVAGLGGHACGNLCSECLLQLNNINELDQSKWPPRTYAEHYAHAQEWRDALSETHRTETFREYGARWSELLRLPYWDPTLFVVIDSMHGFYLRLFQRHIRDVWGMNVDYDDGDGVPELILSEDDISKAQHTLRYGSLAGLEKLKRIQMQYLCREAGLHYGARKASLRKALIKYRMDQGWPNQKPTLPTSAHQKETDGPTITLPFVQAPILGQDVQPSDSTSPPLLATSSSTPAPNTVNVQIPPHSSLSSSSVASHLSPSSSTPASPAHQAVLLQPPAWSLLGDGSGGGGRTNQPGVPDRELLAMYQTATNTALNKIRKRDLARLLKLKLGGTEKTKEKIVEKLYTLRVQDGIIGATGRVIPIDKREVQLNDTASFSFNDNDNVSITPASSHIIPNTSDATFGVKETSTIEEVPEETREKLENVYQSGSKNAVERLKKSLLTVLCVMKLKGAVSRDEYQGMTKIEMAKLLHDARVEEGIVTEDGMLVDDNSAAKKNAVLGQATLTAVRDDMEKILLPPWFNPAPKHPGEVKWGKFKAAEWKAFCTVNLPITLTRLWGSKAKDSAHYLMLENFMHLVTAVKIANKRTITYHDIDLYKHHIETYMSGFATLYPYMSITPYQHLALHFPAHLRRFGPTHSWRCFAFERLNGLIQNLPSNNRFGEMEKSKFLRFCRMQNVRGLFTEARLPQELGTVVDMFDKRYNVKVTGAEDLEFPTGVQTHQQKFGNLPAVLKKEHVQCFERWMILNNDTSHDCSFISSNHTVFSHVTRFGQRFESGKRTNGNGNVVFRGSGGVDLAGQLIAIFSYTRQKNEQSSTEIFTILREYQVLSAMDQQHDSLQHLPLAVGFQVYNRLSADLKLIPFNNIRSHFVSSELLFPDMTAPTLQIIPLR